MSGGVAAALDEAMEGRADMADVVQAGLFDDLDETDTGSLTAPSPLGGALRSAKKARGRPKGSKNKTTEAVRAWLLLDHRHPVKVMMEAYSMTPIQLAETMGLQRETVTHRTSKITVVDGKQVEEITEYEVVGDHYSNDDLIDLLKLQLRMAEVTAPYVMSKVRDGDDGGTGPTLNVSFSHLALGSGSGVSSPARGVDLAEDFGGGMSVRLGQVGRTKSDDDLED